MASGTAGAGGATAGSAAAGPGVGGRAAGGAVTVVTGSAGAGGAAAAAGPGAAEALLAWFAAARRDLPWRRARDPYRTWVSEVMLQQTRVETVVPYFERFIERFPDPATLATAPEDEVLRLWQGLGYYGRARSLHRAVAEVVARYGGRVPDDPSDFGGLPGVGPYTAAAVLSLAYGRDLAAVDGNVRRVLARWHGSEEGLDRVAAALLPPGRAGQWNEALMELGATVCLPRRPRCDICPLSPWCLKRTDLPARRRRGPLPVERRSAVVATDGRGRWCLVRRPPRGLLAGLWEFPQLDDLAATDVRPAGEFRHVFTHLVWQVVVYTARAAAGPPGCRWLPAERLGEVPCTGLTVRIAARVSSG